MGKRTREAATKRKGRVMDRTEIWDKTKSVSETLLIVLFVANNLVATAIVLQWAELPELGNQIVASVLFAYAVLYLIIQIYRGIDRNRL